MVNGWKKVKIKRISDPLKGNALSKDKLTYEGKYKCILYGELFTKYKEVIRKVESRTNFHEGTLSRDGDILIPGSTTTVGIDLARASALNEGNILLGGDINILRKVDDSYVSNFLAYYITHNCKTAIAKIAQGSTIIHLYGKNLIELEICLPPVEEQKPIVAVLLKVDEALEQTEKLIEKNKLIKAGLMQDLFTKGIDEEGNIRSEKTHKFKDSPLGRIPEEWDVKSIAKLATITTGDKDTQDRVEWGKYPFFVRSQQVEKIDSYSYDGEAILTAGDGVGTGKVFHYINGKFNFHQRVYMLSKFSADIYPKYLFEYFRINFLKEVEKYSAKTTVDSVRYHMIAEMQMPTPKINEQQKISLIFCQIDSAIENATDELSKLNKLKTGLMQDLLTGKVRVTPLMREAVAQNG